MKISINRPLSRSVSLCLLILIAGCTHRPADQPNFTDQAQRQTQQVTNWTKINQTGEETASLTALIDADELTRLITRALDQNPSLQQRWWDLKISEAQARISKSDRLPSVDGSIDIEKSEGADTGFATGLSISWEADIWRKLDDRYQASIKDVGEQKMLYRAARDLLAANIMKSWLGLIQQQIAIQIETERLNSLQTNENFILQRYRIGLGTLEDLDSARSNVASSRATLVAYNETLDQLTRSLKQLSGDIPQLNDLTPFKQIENYPAVITSLANLPEQTLQRRPDLIAAYLAIEANDYRNQAAYKDMLPSLNLSAALSDLASNPTDALMTNPVWTLLAQLTAPLYRGGELDAAADISRYQTAQSYQVYRETLLTAVQEVEDTLGQERSLTRQLEHIDVALNSAQNNLVQYEKRYRAGLVDILDLLLIQQQTYDLQAQKNQLLAARLTNRVDLGLALGLGVSE